MEFVAVDVETANADMSSICQVGIAKFVDDRCVDEWVSLVDPEDYFDFVNIDIHGITEDQVYGKPKFPDIVESLRKYLAGTTCICHTHFDRVSIDRAFQKYQIQPFDIGWLDSARIARRAWEEFAWKGYGLANVCQKIGYEFRHHDALEDAKAAGHVVLAAIRESNLDLEEWKLRVNHPINEDNFYARGHIREEGNPEGALFGNIVVFTGQLSVPRADAATLAANIGCAVHSSVTKKTTLLVVGDQDISKLAGHSKSSKHRKAEQLISKGQQLRILKESDFIELVNS